MSRIDAASSTQTTADAGPRDLRDLDLDQFLQLMITELQNQDPLDPMDNSQILQQITQIREISATDSMQETLAAVASGQNLSTASSLIGREVKALSDDGTDIIGVVDKVSVEVDQDDNTDRTLKAHIGKHSFELENIREIVELDDSESTASDDS